ncbi:MAG: thioredoxin domain-containing protein [Acidimicrobiia bacterium]
MNRLAHESSPYLRQHAENPVDWYPWGDEALQIAQERDCPILLSVGYSSCHWCHVMAHESFEHDATAALMNANFVCVKVDREERPDVDAIYMEAVQRMTGHGGWPMTVFLAPDGRPFFGGTYFPRDARPGMPSFTQILTAVHEAWTTNRGELVDQAEQLTRLIAASNTLTGESSIALTPAHLEKARTALCAQADDERGGFGRAPKFPMAMALRFLLTQPRSEHGMAVALRALDAMAAGGIHDHVGGGFHRYSTDNEWLVPHFEKMLYDQATLLRAYSAAYAVTGSDHYAQVACGIVDYVTRDLAHPDGGWYAAEDADSEGVEGAFYCWQPEELRAALGARADAVIAWSAVTPSGNFTDPHTGFRGTILHAANGDPNIAPALHTTLAELRAVRASRVRPGLDDKVLLGWNAMFAAALAEAAVLLDHPEWTALAVRNVRWLLHTFTTASGFARSWQHGTARHHAVLEDVAALLDACVTVGALAAPELLDDAARIATILDTYRDGDGVGWFSTHPDVELVVRPKDCTDNAVPSGIALACDALVRFAVLSGDHQRVQPVHQLLATLTEPMERHPLAFGRLLEAAARALTPAREIVVIDCDATAQPLQQIAASALGANDVCVFADVTAPGAAPLLEGRTGAAAPAPMAYVCRNSTCDQPTDDPEALRAQLA